jgi:hypothetical protein
MFFIPTSQHTASKDLPFYSLFTISGHLAIVFKYRPMMLYWFHGPFCCGLPLAPHVSFLKCMIDGLSRGLVNVSAIQSLVPIKVKHVPRNDDISV